MALRGCEKVDERDQPYAAMPLSGPWKGGYLAMFSCLGLKCLEISPKRRYLGYLQSPPGAETL